MYKLTDKDKKFIENFMNENCALCGTQSCVLHLDIFDAEDLSHCSRYNGEIEGILRIKSTWEKLEENMIAKGITWEDIRKSLNIKGTFKENKNGIRTDSRPNFRADS